MASSSRILSLNIGSQTVSLAEFVATEKGGLTVNAFASRDMILEGSGETARGPQITAAIKEVLADLKMRPGPVGCSIPAQSVFTRFVKLPTVDEDKVEQIIGFEAQQNVPFPINEVVWDYQLMSGGDPGKIGVVLVAIKSDLLAEIDGGVENAGMPTRLVDVAPMALYNAFRYNYSDVKGSSLLIDIGAKTTNLIFVEPQKIFSRSIPIGGNSATAAIAKEFNESLALAERRKKRDGFVSLGGAYEEPEDPEVARVSKIVRNTMTRLHAEINRSVSFYRSQQQGTAPVRVYLCGGSAGTPYMREFFQEKMQLPIEFLNPLRNVTVSPTADLAKITAEAHSLGELVGVALRAVGACPVELNLLPPEVVRRQEMAGRQPAIILAGICLLLALLAWTFYFHQATVAVRSVNEKISAEIATLQGFDQQFKAAASANKLTAEKAAPLLAVVNQKQAWVQLINDINQRLPANRIWVTLMEPLQDGKPLAVGDLKAFQANAPTATPAVGPKSVKKGPTKQVSTVPVVPAGLQINGISLKGLYLDDQKALDPAAKLKVIDDFIENLGQSPYFNIDRSRMKEINPYRQTPDQSTWAWEYELRLPLKTPIPIK